MIQNAANGARERIRSSTLFNLRLGIKRMLWGYTFLFIPFTYLTIVRFIPTFLSLNMSLRKWSVLNPAKTWVGFDNFIRLAEDARFWKSLSNNFKIAIAAVPTQIILGLAIALLLQRITKFRGLFRLIYFIPFMTVLPAVGKVWKWAYVPEIGTFNMILQQLGLPEQPFLQSTSQALPSVIAVIVWQSVGFAVVIMLAGLNQIPKTYYEAAELDGASLWQQIRHITIPLLNTSIVFLAITLTISALQTFTLIFLFADYGTYLGGPLDATRTLVIHVFEYGFRRYEMGYASAMTVVMLFIMIVLAVMQIRILSRRIEY